MTTEAMIQKAFDLALRTCNKIQEGTPVEVIAELALRYSFLIEASMAGAIQVTDPRFEILNRKIAKRGSIELMRSIKHAAWEHYRRTPAYQLRQSMAAATPADFEKGLTTKDQ